MVLSSTTEAENRQGSGPRRVRDDHTRMHQGPHNLIQPRIKVWSSSRASRCGHPATHQGVVIQPRIKVWSSSRASRTSQPDPSHTPRQVSETPHPATSGEACGGVAHTLTTSVGEIARAQHYRVEHISDDHISDALVHDDLISDDIPAPLDE